MKTFAFSLLTLGITTLILYGQGSEAIIKQRAKNIADQNNARGATPPAPPVNPAAAVPAPASAPNPALTATLQNIASLQSDFARLETNGAAKSQLIVNLTAAATEKKPSPNSISKLAGDLASALTGKKLAADPQKKLAQFCHAIANGSHLSAMQEQAVFEGAQKILETAQVPPGDAAKVVADMKEIVQESK